MAPYINLTRVSEYLKDIEKLSKKRLRHLESDLEIVYSVLKTHPEAFDSTNYRRIQLGQTVEIPVYKLRKIHSTDLHDNRTLRLIYAVDNSTDEIILVEVYSKSDKENHDETRILKYFTNKVINPH